MTIPPTPVSLNVDFVSDISCPWCAIALHALEQAAARVKDQIVLDWHFQPFELNPHMGAHGQDLQEHLHEKYGSTLEQFHQIHADIARRGAALGFMFDNVRRTRIYNTFDAHRLLHWADHTGEPGQQKALKHALFAAYFTQGDDPGDHDVLLRVAGDVGLDVRRARAVLRSTEFTDAVRARQAFYQEQGIRAVPAIIINHRHLLQGGQPVDVFEQALRRIAAGSSVEQ